MPNSEALDGRLNESDALAEHDHSEWVRRKIEIGLAQSRDRAAMIPLEQVWRDLGLA